MEQVFPPYHVFISHRGPDVKKTLASLLYHHLELYGLRVFLDKHELQAGDSLTPAIKSAISSASVQIAIFSKTYAQSAWCLNELLWMLDSHNPSKIIPIFYDIQPSDLRHVEKGAYASAFQKHRGRVTKEQVDRWISALNETSHKSGVVHSTETDDLGELLEKIVETVLKEVRREVVYVDKYPEGLREAAEDFEKWLQNNQRETAKVVGIVGLGGSGKSSLATHLYNSKRSQFWRRCFLSDVSKCNLLSLLNTLVRDLLLDPKSCMEDTRRGKIMLQDRLRGKDVLIVFEDIENTEQIENLLFVKDVVGSGSLILLTSRDQSLFLKYNIQIYNIKLLKAKDAKKLFHWHAFGSSEPVDNLQAMVEELVGMCSGFPLALKVLAGKLQNERDPRKWKKEVESLREHLPSNLLDRIVKNSYESLEMRERETFLDIAHFLNGEDEDMVKRVLDGLNGSGSHCLQSLRQKCLVESESADMFPPIKSVDFVSWKIGISSRAKTSFKRIRMHDLVRDFAVQIGRQESSLRLCHRKERATPRQISNFNVRGIRTDVPDPLIGSTFPCKDSFWWLSYSQSQNICGLKLLAIENSTLERLSSVSGDLIWFRLHQSKGTSTPSIPSTLFLTNVRVLEVHGVTLPDFCKLLYDREPPSHLRELKVTCPLVADSSTAGFPKIVFSASKPSYSLRHHIPSTSGQWFQAWLEMLDFKGLGKIVLQNIAGLKTLPISFKETRNLRHVDLCGCSDLKVLPDSFTEELSQLQYLAVRDCRKLVLPTLGKISTLEYLDCEGCSMLKKLPRGTEAQKSLKYLNVLHTKLTELPRDFQQLENLEELHIGSPYLREIGRLPGSLITLNLLNCSSLRTMADLATLVGLKLLQISGRVKLKTLNLDGLKSIEVLKADNCSKLQSIQGRLDQLQKLSYLQISLASLPRSNCTEILTCAPSISTAVLSGSSMYMKKVDVMDEVAGRFEGVKVRRILKSAELEGYEKPKGTIFLYLMTHPYCNIEVTFFGHVYAIQSSAFTYPVHILMWTKDSEVFKEFGSSSDKAQDLNWFKTSIKKGWIVEAQDSQVCKHLISFLVHEGYV